MKFFIISIAVFIALCTLGSCKQGQESPPVSREKMGKVILDLQLAEAYSQGLGEGVKNRFEKNTDSLTGFYSSVLKHHGMTFSEFEEALQWYKERPLLMDSLYNGILTQLIVIKSKRGIKDTEEDKPAHPATDTSLHRMDTMKPRPIAGDTLQKNKGKDSLSRVKKLIHTPNQHKP